MELFAKYRDILRIAIPSIVSNISVPLLGMVDMTITGHLGSEVYIGAISVGGMCFNMIYWLFSFLRFGTGALTSQAYGRRSFEDCALSLVRSIMIVFMMSILLIVFQKPIKNFVFGFMNASNEVLEWAGAYFDIVIYGAVGFLGLFSTTGWYVGMQNTKIPLVVSVIQNVVNIVLSLVFVFWFDMGLRGVAFGTLLAQISGFALALALCFKYYGRVLRHLDVSKILNVNELIKFFKINSMIFFRTLCMVAVMTYFTVAGTGLGNEVLAANAVLMQFFMVFSYFIDGFAYAGEALCGKHFGAGDITQLRYTMRRLFRIGWMMAAVFAVLYLGLGRWIVSIFTDQKAVVEEACNYIVWIAAVPLMGLIAFTLDGVYVGCGYVVDMFVSTAAGATAFFALWFGFGYMGNHTLWLAFNMYLLVRGLTLQISSRMRFKN